MKEVLSYGVAIAGLVITLVAFAATVGKQKYRAMAPLMLHNLHTASQRAEMLCHHNPLTALEAIGAAIKAGALAYSRDPAKIAEATRPAYTAAAAPIAKHWGDILKRARTGIMVAGGGAVLAILTDVSAGVQLLIALVAGIAALLVLLHKLDLERSLVLARAQLLPEVERMFVEGRYAYAAAPPAPEPAWAQ